MSKTSRTSRAASLRELDKNFCFCYNPFGESSVLVALNIDENNFPLSVRASLTHRLSEDKGVNFMQAQIRSPWSICKKMLLYCSCIF